MKILIVIVNHNGKNLLKKNLPYILKTRGVSYNICVVDNNSTDDSVSFLEKEYPQIKTIQSKENMGYGKAHNLALEEYPNYDYYLFMNNDIRVTSDWLVKMLDVFNNKEKVGAVGPKILLSQKRDGREVINSAGMDINNHYIAYDRYSGEYDQEKYSVVEKVDGISGAAMLISKEVLEKVKGFHPKMFLYYEDVDLSLRIRDAGYDIYYCGTSIVYHDHMASTRSLGSFKRNWMNMQNRYVSINDRFGFFIAIKETLWYLFSWGVWKLFHAKSITLKEYLDGK